MTVELHYKLHSKLLPVICTVKQHWSGWTLLWVYAICFSRILIQETIFNITGCSGKQYLHCRHLRINTLIDGYVKTDSWRQGWPTFETFHRVRIWHVCPFLYGRSTVLHQCQVCVGAGEPHIAWLVISDVCLFQ